MPALTSFVNPLDAFNSYSVHYIMLACRTTEEARVFIDTDENVQRDTLSAINDTKRLGDAISYNGVRNVAYLVMDTRRFAQFSVERLKYEVLINGLEKQGSHGNLATTVEMTILDSVGISFINFLQWLMDHKMQCNFDGMIFMLRVVFVGHTDSGGTETVQTLTIPMHLFKLEVNLDYSKGAYTAEFMPNINFDAQQHNRWLNISQASTFFTGAGNNTLGGIVNSFERELNKRSAEHYRKASSLLQQTRGTTGKYGRQVKYMITLPDGNGKKDEDWNTFEVLGWGTNKATEILFKKALEDKDGTTAATAAQKKQQETAKPGQPIDTTFSVETGMQITEVLDLIFRQVPRIAELGNGQATADKSAVSFYKHLVGISSNDDYVVVHVDVIPFRVPNIITAQDAANKQISPGEQDLYTELKDRNGRPTGVRVPKDFIEFDYIFTGKNKDILNFDMKIQDLQWMLASNLDMGAGVMQEVSAEGQDKKQQPINTNAELVVARPFDPLLLPKNTAAEFDNFGRYSTMVQASGRGDQIRANQQDYTKNLSAFYAASPITTNITIRGNPSIMLKFTAPDFMPHMAADTATGIGASSTTNTEVKTQYRKQLRDRIIRDNKTATGQDEIREENGTFVVQRLSQTSYASAPVFVKINVHGPNVDFLSNEMVNEHEFSKAILDNNYYVVMKITNLIEGGNFTQDLELFSHNVFGKGKIQGPPDKSVKGLT